MQAPEPTNGNNTSLPSGGPPPEVIHAPPTPLAWRVIIGVLIFAVAGLAYMNQTAISPRTQAMIGIFFFFGIVAMFSTNLRAVNWKTIGWGIGLQLALALAVLHAKYTHVSVQQVVDEEGNQKQVEVQKEYSVRGAFEFLGDGVKEFIKYSDEGAKFVFGNLAVPGDLAGVYGEKFLFPFAFKALPPILFVSAFFTVLYHFGVLQFLVRCLAVVMTYLMGTSGAETLSVSANVFMGQTEAPLIVKPYVPRMTNSELFALMASGMAHISGGMMAVYINYGADPVAVLTTCIMACPCSLYLSKLFMPELSRPETAGNVKTEKTKSPYVNAVDAAAAGTGDGLRLALNVAAMLIVFIAFVALFDGILGLIDPQKWFGWTHWELPPAYSLKWIFGKLFSPVAFLMGVESADQAKVGELLGCKLSINEHFAYLTMKNAKAAAAAAGEHYMSPRSLQLAAYALTGFANFSSVGIQLGGIGAMAPERRHDLARLGMRALFVGFTATLLNAAMAGVISDLSK
jgi:CNT family concentrative nucleoside transporter